VATRVISPKCFFAAWIFGWVVAIYLPSALFALTGLSPLAEGRGFFAATFAIADEVAPAAKIGFAVLLGLLLFATRKARLRRAAIIAADMLFACAAMFLVLALLPAAWSRGFGVGMVGVRFMQDVTLIYLAGAALAGLVFSLSEARCRGRRMRSEPGSA
jgi:hypothetical protein